MTLLSHIGRTTARAPFDVLRRPRRTVADRPLVDVGSQDTGGRADIDRRVFAVQRLGAVGVGLILLVFGLLGARGGVGFLSTHGERYLGMSSNGLLSALSLIVAAALRGPRPASIVMIVLGVLFLLSGLLNMALLRTAFNLLAFRMSNVVFSFVVGLLMLLLGAYGRISGNLPANSPFAHPSTLVEEPPDLPSGPKEVAAEAAMREAEIAVVQHYATEDQQRRVQAMSRVHTGHERRQVWMRTTRPPVQCASLEAAEGRRRLTTPSGDLRIDGGAADRGARPATHPTGSWRQERWRPTKQGSIDSRRLASAGVFAPPQPGCSQRVLGGELVRVPCTPAAQRFRPVRGMILVA